MDIKIIQDEVWFGNGNVVICLSDHEQISKMIGFCDFMSKSNSAVNPIEVSQRLEEIKRVMDSLNK
jgi:hypothetical protein